jgi:hypothetical protein
MSPLLRLGLLMAAGFSPSALIAEDVVAGRADELSVTVYRAPGRASGGLALNALNGFALVREARTVSLPAGESQIRFEGVADGIDSASALLTGLPAEVLEKNRDAELLSPSSLVAATVGKSVELLRTDPKNGHSSRLAGKIIADAGAGVLFESSEGIEALRCSGLPETFNFSGGSHLDATPTLTTLVRSPAAVTASVTLSYLARGFDWSANYVATVAPDGRSVDLGAWVTLANGNSASFKAAHTQVVAGRLNRESGLVEPVAVGSPILAQCWPNGTTSDIPIAVAYQLLEAPPPMPPAPANSITVSAARVAKLVEEEQLGDLKLYRVPERTTISSRQMKQVRLLDRLSVPIELRYLLDLPVNQDFQNLAARRVLRTRNDSAHHLGIPLPSGQVATFERHGDTQLLLSESPLPDIAVDEEFDIDLGSSPAVRISQVRERVSLAAGSVQDLPLIPGLVHLRTAEIDAINRIEVSNARGTPVRLELRLRMPVAMQLNAADHPVTMRYDRPVFVLTVAAGDSATIRYRTEHTSSRAVPH